MRRFLLAVGLWALLVGCFYTGSKVYKSFQPGNLVICGFESNQRVRILSPKYNENLVNERVAIADSSGAASFIGLGQGLWYVMDREDHYGWSTSGKFGDAGFYVYGAENRSYNCYSLRRSYAHAPQSQKKDC